MTRLFIVGFLFLGTSLLGCGSDCKKLKSECNQVIERAAKLNPKVGEEELHFALILRDAFLEEVAQKSVISMVEKGLKIKTKLSIGGGKKIAVSTLPKIKNLKIRADKACDHCIRISGALSGKASIEVPILGKQNLPLHGNLSIVAPLKFVPAQSGRSAIEIDFSKAIQYNPRFLSLTLKQIPPTWSRVISSSFSKQAIKEVARQLKPVRIFEFENPNFGINNLKIAPRLVKTEPKNHTIFIGFTTNLATRKKGKGLRLRTELSRKANIGIGIDPRLFGPASSLLMASGKIPRRYSKNGKGDPKGPIRITMKDFELREGKGKLPAKISFRYWQLPDEGTCLWADVEAAATLGVERGKIALRMKEFRVIESSLPKIIVDFATWMDSGFSANQEKVMSAPLQKNPIKLPGSRTLKLAPLNAMFSSGGLWLETKASIK